jgi:hypothetical protein
LMQRARDRMAEHEGSPGLQPGSPGRPHIPGPIEGP